MVVDSAISVVYQSFTSLDRGSSKVDAKIVRSPKYYISMMNIIHSLSMFDPYSVSATASPSPWADSLLKAFGISSVGII